MSGRVGGEDGQPSPLSRSMAFNNLFAAFDDFDAPGREMPIVPSWCGFSEVAILSDFCGVENDENTICSPMVATLFAAVLTLATDGTWTGYISDSNCGAKGANNRARECTIKCVQDGARYVFVNVSDK
ncbi:MAG: hypothetical protein WBD19_10535, partial [Candidatus Acidiferrum sp.]